MKKVNKKDILQKNKAKAENRAKEIRKQFEEEKRLEEKIDQRIKEKQGKITTSEIEKLPEIFYDSETGIGYVNGKRFKFKDNQPEFKVFGNLYNRIGKKLPRNEVLKMTGIENKEPFLKEPKWINHKKKDTDVSDTYAINELAKKIRKRTGLTPDQLVNNNGNLTLRGRKLKKSS